ncbi:hypothetical protein [Ureibacillus chungkukjangi]|uniref:hypothetical protein n=1 Tax=Ureibacillus chungkukjangi TaxID=1202712 RepID=UPI00203BDE27|nr:hypothetical protein [Ureibacillus chungkukjangi]
MGTSKYEFNPEQFDIDVINNQKRYKDKYNFIELELFKLIQHDPIRQNESWEMIIDILRQYKINNK